MQGWERRDGDGKRTGEKRRGEGAWGRKVDGPQYSDQLIGACGLVSVLMQIWITYVTGR